MITKKRSKIRSERRQVPQLQYKDEATGFWIDAPWFIFTLQELRAYLFALGIKRYHTSTRIIESYREASYL